jgi:hypothetical protein
MTESQRSAYAEICKAWDDLDQAAQRIVTALPFQMTEASERLDEARKRMRQAIQTNLLNLMNSQGRETTQ